MPSQTTAAEKILQRFKGLRQQMQAGETPLFTIPAIWDAGQETHNKACDVIVTNQRVFGYIHVTFPRERLFLDALPLASIRAVSLRQKAFEPVFRELVISDNKRKVYIRARRQKIVSLNEALRAAISQHASTAHPSYDTADTSSVTSPQVQAPSTPIYGKQEIRGTFERSPLAIVLLFVGGLLLEIAGALIWAISHSAQTGLPLCVAGLVAVVTSILVLRQRRIS
ncbi:MAG TPA: hypothetical protein VNE38_00340 [Ktedonobacteraceae bacterium]|nr:hypothetical protein [Ktedonobacteraceae bacterium]